MKMMIVKKRGRDIYIYIFRYTERRPRIQRSI